MQSMPLCEPGKLEIPAQRHYTACNKAHTMKKQPPQRFWEVDLVALLLMWWNDISTFVKTALMFCALALPVIIPSLIMWWMLVNNISFESPFLPK